MPVRIARRLVFLPLLAAVPVCAQDASEAGASQRPGSVEVEGVGEPASRYDLTPGDDVDARSPHDTEAARMLRRVERSIDEGRWDRAREAILFLLDRADGAVVRLADGSAASVEREANRLLTTFPPDRLRDLRDQYAGVAADELRRAAAGGAVEAIRQVAVRFRRTPAGAEAVVRLARLHEDRGEVRAAARLLRDLLADPDPPPPSLAGPDGKRWAAAVLLAAGEPGAAAGLVGPAALDGLAARPASAEPPAAAVPFAHADAAGGADAADAPVRPLLVPRWTVPLFDTPAARAAADELIDLLEEEDRPLIPAARPLVVGGLVIARVPGGLVAVDAGTGRTRWRTRPSADAGVSSADAGGDDVAAVERALLRGRFELAYDGGDASAAEFRPLASRLFRDAADGQLSTDGRLLFALDPSEGRGEEEGGSERGPGGFGRFGQPDTPAAGRTTRVLTAFEAATGRPVWSVGGPALGEPFDLPLAGWTVLGVPTADGGDLFLVAERDREIHLHVLDARTGRPRWSRRVAHSEESILTDPARRRFSARVALAGGTAVVPTTVGWLTGVDRLTREVLWTARHVPRDGRPPQDRANGMFRPRRNFRRSGGGPEPALGGRWAASVPVAAPFPVRAGDDARTGVGSELRVVHAPQEDGRLVCVDPLTGGTHWSVPRNSRWLALAGIHVPAAVDGAGGGPADGSAGETAAPGTGLVIVTGTDRVEALSLADGRPVWRRDLTREQTLPDGRVFPGADGPPRGPGLLRGDRLFVPLAGDALLTLDPADGRPLAHDRVPDPLFADRPEPAGGSADHDRPRVLGTLTAAGGRLVSLGPTGFAAFADRDAVEAELAARPDVPAARLERAALRRASDPPAEVLAALEAIPADALGPADRGRLRTLVRATASAVVRGGDAGPDREADLLARLRDTARTPRERIDAARLSADREERRGDGAAAVAVLLALADAHLPPAAGPTAGDSADPGDAADGAAFAGIPTVTVGDGPQRLTVRLDRWLAGRLGDLRRDGGAAAAAAIDAAARDRLAADPAAAARLFPFDPAVAADRLRRAADELAETRSGAAELTLLQLAVHPDVDPAAADAALAPLRDGAATRPAPSAAGGMRAEARRYGPPDDGTTVLDGPAAPRGFFRTHRVVLDGAAGKVDVVDAAGAVASRLWLNAAAPPDPFDADASRSPRGGRAAAFDGGVLFLTRGGTVHALVPRTGAVLWTAPAPGAAADGGRGYGRGSAGTFQQVNSAARPGRALVGGDADAAVPVQNAGVVVVREGRTVRARDPLTGRTLWTRGPVSAGTTVVGTRAAVVLLDPDADRAVAVRALDGTRLPNSDRVESLARAAVLPDPAAFVTLERLVRFFDFGDDQYQLAAHDPLTGSVTLLAALAAEDRVAGLGDGRVAVLREDGRVELVDRGATSPADRDAGAAAAAVPLGTLTAADREDVRSVHAVADADRVFLLLHRGDPPRSSGVRRPGVSPAVPANGRVVAFDAAGGRLWDRPLEDRYLVAADFARQPCLLFARQRDAGGPPGGVSVTRIEVLALDRDTGRELLDASLPTINGLNGARVPPAGGAIDLDGYNVHWRLERGGTE